MNTILEVKNIDGQGVHCILEAEYGNSLMFIIMFRKLKIGSKTRSCKYSTLTVTRFCLFCLDKISYKVICVDLVHVVAVDIPIAAKLIRPTLGNGNVALIQNGHISIELER